MGNPWEKFDPIDIIALALICGCVISMAIRGDNVFKEVLQTVVGFYFGHQTGKGKRGNGDHRNTGMVILLSLSFYT